MSLRQMGSHRSAATTRPYVRYDEVADASADLVIRSYSSSFGLASRLLAGPIRRDVRNIYALSLIHI